MNPSFFLTTFFLALGSLAAGAVGALILHRRDTVANGWAHSFAAIGSVFGIMTGAGVLWGGTGISFVGTGIRPFFALAIHIDALAAFFVLIISVVSLMSSIYGIGYMKHFFGKYSLAAFGFFYNLFLMSLLLVVTAYDGFYFLFVWEIMSLASYFLVIFENKKRDSIDAGFLYLVMTHVGTALIMIALLLVYRSVGSLDFGVMKAHAAALTPGIKHVIFVLALLGFGTKAGIIPLHIWLPRAHPAAPSHVSALMSGVMIKTAIFMLIRLFVDLFGTGPVWWGLAVVFLGSVSSLIGVLYALAEHDIKRLLAYHSVENIGIILLGLGSAMVFKTLGMPTAALLGLAAALFHTMNHAIFKALLFLAAGSVVSATHTLNMEEYGGLLKRMPLTGVFFLIGAAAISALPPLNGFASEWLTFQALFVGIGVASFWVKAVFIFAGAALATTGGLAAACFVKAFGITFLAKPRSHESEQAKESSTSLQWGMAPLALLCILLGLFAVPVVSRLSKIAASIELPRSIATGAVSGIIPSVLALGLLLAVVVGLVYVLTRLFSRSRKVSTGITWDCGSPLTPRMEITATGFSRSLIMIFQGFLRQTKQTTEEYHDANQRYFPSSQAVNLSVVNVYDQYFYQPLKKVVFFFARQISRLQSGNINLYLLYMFIALMGTIVWAVSFAN